MIDIIIGYIFGKIGLSVSSARSERFIRGWFLGSGISVKAYSFITRKYFKNEFQLFFAIKTRNDFKFSINRHFYDCHKSIVFSFGYGLIGFHYY